mmetsp:Transcript_1281/g.3652  ORF Transcript_1281/g.3652 Transcript_1281/m.3652 type:complete len:234 (-) Transcript_1281:57-758(-)
MESDGKSNAQVFDIALDALAWATGLSVGSQSSLTQPLEGIEKEINVAVTGKSGSGKSSLINTLLGVSPGAPGAAAVGVCETTMKPTAYTVPHLPNFKLWDIPGADTQEFASETYITSMGLTHFDMIVIIVQSPYTGTEQTITLKLQSCGIPHFVVRSKVDLDIDNNLDDHDIPEHETLASIREDMLQHGIDRPYLVSSRRPHDLDMDRLSHDLVQTVLLFACEKKAAEDAQVT